MAFTRIPSSVGRKLMKKYRKPSSTRSVYRKTVSTGKSAISSLQSQLTKLRRQVNITKSEPQYNFSFDDNIGNTIGDNVWTKPLMKFDWWKPVFGASSDDYYPNECRIMKTNLDLTLDTRGEKSNIDYSLYIVTLTKFGYQELVDPATGFFTGPLVRDVHYTGANNSASGVNYGSAWLNKKYFNILMAKRWMTGVEGNNSTETISLRKRLYKKFLWNKGRGIYHKNPSGNWNGKTHPASPSGNVFLILFNNDSTIDGEYVGIHGNVIHTLQV